MQTISYNLNNNQIILISICIPTFNRGRYLENCLLSIYKALSEVGKGVEICVSDNSSTDNTFEVIEKTRNLMPIKYNRNAVNVGMARNIIKVVSMARGEFVWLVGDDDLLMPNGISKLIRLLKNNPKEDFFYVNANHLESSVLEIFPHPFDTADLPVSMERFSKSSTPRSLNFFELISPSISFDFLGGIFLSVFRREKWNDSLHVLDKVALDLSSTFSHFDNTFPHLKVWASAFRTSKAYFNPDPLIVCITGLREWSAMSPLIMSVRLPEALRIYRLNGMSLVRYIYCMNYAFRNFASDFANLFLHRNIYNFNIPFFKIVILSIPYPNTYMSPFYFIVRRIHYFFKLRKCWLPF